MSCKCSPVLVPTNRGPYTYFNNETPSYSGEFSMLIGIEGLPEGTFVNYFQLFDTENNTLSDEIAAEDVWDSTLEGYVIPEVTSTTGIMITCASDSIGVS